MSPIQSKKRYDFPSDYVVIDLEMTGLSTDKDFIIELAGVKVKDNTVLDTFQTLIKPPILPLSPYVISLTNITDSMLLNAPYFSEIIPYYLDFLEDLPLVGHNILIDIAFLNKELLESNHLAITNDYIDTLPISQKLFPEFIHHRLTNLADYYEIDISGMHRALNDCFITNSCFKKLSDTMKSSFPSEDDYKDSFTQSGRRLKAEQVTATITDFSSSNPAYKKIFAFTGILKSLSRREAMLQVANRGGFLTDKVTEQVDYLVLGIGEEEILTANGISRKLEKANKLQKRGRSIQILSEQEFLALLNIK